MPENDFGNEAVEHVNPGSEPLASGSVESELLWKKDVGVDDLIAFALYYRQRSEWETAFFNTRQKEPSADQREIFDLSWNNSRIMNLKSDAQLILNAYASEISSEALKDYNLKIFKAEKNQAFRQVALSAAGTILSIFGLAMGTFLVSPQILEILFKYKN